MKKYLNLLILSSILSGMVFAEEQTRVEIGGRRPVTKESEKLTTEVANQEVTSEKEEVILERSTTGSRFGSTHTAAYHKPFRVSLFGDEVELEDGSIWRVRKSDRTKTYDWLTSDDIAVTINHSWFSTHQFCLTNLATGKRVEADLYLGPIYNGVYTRWIVGIDYINCQIVLNDTSVWDVSGFDRFTLDSWVLNDTIIIGHDDTILGLTNILINVSAPKKLNSLTFVSANCVY
jgi:hypothetical protein